jgi:hypothetical protein
VARIAGETQIDEDRALIGAGAALVPWNPRSAMARGTAEARPLHRNRWSEP